MASASASSISSSGNLTTQTPPTPPYTPMKRKRTASMSSATSIDSTFGMRSLDTSMASSCPAAAPVSRLSAIPRALRDEDEPTHFHPRVTMSPRSEHMARTMDDLHLKERGSDTDEDATTRMKRKRIRFRDENEVIGQSLSQPSDYSSGDDQASPGNSSNLTSVKATAPRTERRPSTQLPCSLSHRTKRCRRKSPPPPGYSCDWDETAFAYTWSPPSLPTAAAPAGTTASSTSDEEEDDGRGLNGIGFRPTPAIAWAREQRRREQLSNWKMREAKEAREHRAKQRLLARSRISLRGSSKASITLQGRAYEADGSSAGEQHGSNDSTLETGSSSSTKAARVVRFTF